MNHYSLGLILQPLHTSTTGDVVWKFSLQ